MTPMSPLVHAVRAVRKGRRHIADGNLGAAIVSMHMASMSLGGATPYSIRRLGLVHKIVWRLMLDLSVLVDVKCALGSMRNSRKGYSK